jgi:hypothetical protein
MRENSGKPLVCNNGLSMMSIFGTHPLSSQDC